MIPSNDRALSLARHLALEPHPEGGWFRRVYVSERLVRPAGRLEDRRALSSIYYLLEAGAMSRWHRVESDEAWHFHEGEPLEILLLSPGLDRLRVERLGPLGEGPGECAPLRSVPAGWWQAARPLGSYALVGCSVGPGFEYEDFTLMRDLAPEADRLKSLHPGLAGLL